MAIEMDNYTTWIGYGAKFGGSLGLIGAESTDGKVCNLGYTNDVCPISITSMRLGPGLGGGVGVVAMIVFNCINVYELNNTNTSDWSLNISLGGKWSEIVKGVRKRRFYRAVINTMGDLTNATPGELTSIRNTCSYMYSAVEAEGLMPGTPSLMVLDIPAAGIGAELSLSWLYGIISVGALEKDAEQSEGKTFDGSGSGSGMEY